MSNKVYYFIFENEYMNNIINRLCVLFDVSQTENSKIYKGETDQVYVLNALDEGMVCVYANDMSYIYEIYIICTPIHQSEIEELLRSLCDEIEEDYGEDRSRFINCISLKSEIMMKCFEIAEKYGYRDIVERLINC
ncbi:MAG: hypothetical protein E7257_08595 [Lachnospiraceae bacterium]|nr:hypothetical protein [Lachnospiraceae bacterium]